MGLRFLRCSFFAHFSFLIKKLYALKLILNVFDQAASGVLVDFFMDSTAARFHFQPGIHHFICDFQMKLQLGYKKFTPKRVAMRRESIK